MTPDFTSMPKGLASKPNGGDETKWVYILPTSMMSFDDDTGTMRCGQLSTFVCNGGSWFGMTVSQLFKRTWNPDNAASVFPLGGDPKESIHGKVAYTCEWQGEEKADVTQDKSVAKPGIPIGVVFSHTDNMALVMMDKAFTESPRFINQGFWAQAGC